MAESPQKICNFYGRTSIIAHTDGKKSVASNGTHFELTVFTFFSKLNVKPRRIAAAPFYLLFLNKLY